MLSRMGLRMVLFCFLLLFFFFFFFFFFCFVLFFVVVFFYQYISSHHTGTEIKGFKKQGLKIFKLTQNCYMLVLRPWMGFGKIQNKNE